MVAIFKLYRSDLSTNIFYVIDINKENNIIEPFGL